MVRTTAQPEEVVLPTDPEAERWTVGALIVAPETAGEVFAIAGPECFHDEVAAAAVTAIHTAWREGELIDVKLVLRELKRVGGVIADDATEYLRRVAEDIPTGAHAVHYAKKVAEAARKRELLDIGLRLTHDACNGRVSADIIADVLRDTSGVVDEGAAGGDPWKRWIDSLDDRDRRTYFDLAGANNQLNRLRVGPGQFVLLGAPPGFGKTALAVQVTVDALLADESLVALIANCEMDPGTILDRQVARLSEVSYSVVRDRTFAGETYDRVKDACSLLVSLRPRLHFLGPPFTMPRVRAVAMAKGADIVLVDYLQRFKPSTDTSDQRTQVSDVMSDCREIAMAGPAVIGVSAMSRQGQFRESSECEYACDSGFVLEKTDVSDSTALVARCIKNRHGPCEDIELSFDGRYQRHTAAAEVETYADLDPFSGAAG